MIYEIRMTIIFRLAVTTFPSSGYDRIKSTLIDYVEADNVARAYIVATRNKLDIGLDITKEMQDAEKWGGAIKTMAISLDAVVAKPELQTLSKSDNEKASWKPDKSQVLSIEDIGKNRKV